MNRRGFIGAVSGVLAVGAVGVPAAVPMKDAFTYRDWRVRWSGWVEPANQCVTFGYWTALHLPSERMMASTTMGIVQKLDDPMNVINMSRAKGWPSPSHFVLDSLTAKDAVKRRALNVLLESIS
jgi:hypothetical protein